MLPRESLSKETDASLLTVVGFPAFAVEKPELVERTVDEVLTKLGGKYGCKRFLRDGYKNPREDQSRLYYESWELRLFENIECQWPLFYCYLAINACFQRDRESFDKYFSMLKSVRNIFPYMGFLILSETTYSAWYQIWYQGAWSFPSYTAFPRPWSPWKRCNQALKNASPPEGFRSCGPQ